MAKLMLYDSDPSFVPSVSTIAQHRGVGAKEHMPVSTLAEIAKEITKHQQLEELVMFFHGFPGGISLEEEGHTLSDEAVKKAFAKSKTQITAIHFEGCWVGQAPDEMAAFGRLFQAKLVSGFNWARHSSQVTVTVPKNVDEKKLREKMKHFERWMVPNTPTIKAMADMSKQAAAERVVKLEWYMLRADGDPPYDVKVGATLTNFERLGTHSYRKRSEAEEVEVEAAKAKRNDNPTLFEHVTVKL